MIYKHTNYLRNALYKTLCNSRGGDTKYAETVQHHSVGPDASKPRGSHVYVGDPLRNDVYEYSMAGWEGMDHECCVYENPDTKVSTQFRYKIDTIDVCR